MSELDVLVDLANTPDVKQIYVDGVPYRASEIADGAKRPPVTSKSGIRMIGELSPRRNSDPKTVIVDLNRLRMKENLRPLPSWLACETVDVRKVIPPQYLLVGIMDAGQV